MQRLRFFGWWLAGGVLIAVLIATGSLVPPADLPKVAVSDKVEHFGGYLLLSLWFSGLFRPGRYLVVGAALVAFSGGLEIAQGVMAIGRTADWWDFLANTLGVTTGLGIALAGLGSWMLAIERGFGGR